MTGPDPTAPSPTDAQIGYQAAVSLWVYEGNLIWAKFNAFLVANSIILAIYGLSLGSDKLPKAFIVGLPIGGIILSLIWALITRRGFDNYVYWILSARELEEKHLPPHINTVSRGGPFADGHQVSIDVSGQARQLRMSWLSRKLTAAAGAYAVIGVFVLLYVLLLF